MEEIGKLSTSAKEWKPAGVTSSGVSSYNSNNVLRSPTRTIPTLPTSSVLQPTPPGRTTTTTTTSHHLSPHQATNNPVSSTGTYQLQPREYVPGQAWSSNSNTVSSPQPTHSSVRHQGLWTTAASSTSSLSPRGGGGGGGGTSSVGIPMPPQLQPTYSGGDANATMSPVVMSPTVTAWQTNETSSIAASMATPAPPPSLARLNNHHLHQHHTMHSMGVGGIGMSSSTVSSEDMLYQHMRDLTLACTIPDPQMQPQQNNKAEAMTPPPFMNAVILEEGRSSFGYPTTVLRVQNRENGHLYCLRRIDTGGGGGANVSAKAMKVTHMVSEMWNMATYSDGGNGNPQQHHPLLLPTTTTTTTAGGTPRRRRVVEHSNVVQLHRCFAARRALFFQYQYHPRAQTLRDVLFGQQQQQQQQQPSQKRNQREAPPQPFPEATIWAILTQLASAIQAIHQTNSSASVAHRQHHQQQQPSQQQVPLACRSIQLNHILVIPQPGGRSLPDGSGRSTISNRSTNIRVRINCLGVVDVLEWDSRQQKRTRMGEWQALDIRDLGFVLLSLATATEVNRQTSSTDPTIIRQCHSFVQQHYSREFAALVMTLTNLNNHNASAGGGNIPLASTPTIDQICSVLAQHSMRALDTAYTMQDWMSHSLMQEYEASRMLRLLFKLGFVNERPELGVTNRQWQESGDCFVLKLFRDYVFHQADGAGNPIMDVGHVMTCLNKLDAAIPTERIVLVSRDGKTILVTSYAELAQALERAYGELCRSSVG